MIVEYAGIANRWTGPGVVHEVRAWWNVNQYSQGAVKRAALHALRTQGRIIGHAEVIGMDMSTHATPQLNALIRIRVLTPDEVARGEELRTRRYTRCDGCGCDHPGQVVRMHEDDTERALCFTCWNPVKSTCKVLHWIKKDGKLQIG